MPISANDLISPAKPCTTSPMMRCIWVFMLRMAESPVNNEAFCCSASYLVALFSTPFNALKLSTKACTDSLILLLFSEMVKVVGEPGAISFKSKVTPAKTPVTWLVSLVTLIPSTHIEASFASSVCSRFLPSPTATVGSKANWDRPTSSVLFPTLSSLTVIFRLFFSPLGELKTNRSPVPSFKIDAVTSASALLMASRMPCRLLFSGPMTISTACLSVFSVNWLETLS